MAEGGSSQPVVISGRFGRIWTSKPRLSGGGTVAALNFKSGGSTGGRDTALALQSVAFSPLGDSIATIDSAGRVYVLHVTSNRFIQLDCTGSAGTSVAFSTKTKREVFVAFEAGYVKVYDTESSKLQATLRCIRGSPHSIQISDSGEKLLSCSADSLHLWDLTNFSRQGVLDCKQYGASQARFAKEGIITSFRNGTTWLWSKKNMSEKHKFEPPGVNLEGIKDLAVTSRSLAVAGGDFPFLCVWTVADRKVQKGIQLPPGVEGVKQLVALRGTNLVIALCSDDSVKIVDVAAALMILDIKARIPGVTSFAVDNHGNRLVLVSEYGAMTILDLAENMRMNSTEANLPIIELPVERRSPPVESEALGGNQAPKSVRMGGADDKGKDQAAPNSSDKVTRKKLKHLLDTYGEYPSKYRILIWKTLLSVPQNKSAYKALKKQGVHVSFGNLEEDYPIKNTILLDRLARLVSCLAHWTPLFGQVTYLPAFVFPFIKVFGADEASCFEAVATFLTNWCSEWFEMFPGPPLQLLARIEDLLIKADPELARSMSKTGGVQIHAWTLLQSLFSEVLSRYEWLKLLDHVLSNPPLFLECFVVSFFSYFRATILSAPSKEEVYLFFRRSEPLNVNQILLRAYGLKRLRQDSAMWRLSGLLQGDTYPMFASYPEHIVNFQIHQYERLSAEEKELHRKRLLLDEMVNKKQSKETLAGMLKDDQLRQVAAQQRAKISDLDEKILNERIRLEEMEKLFRVQQLEDMERAATSSIAEQQQAYKKEIEALEKELEHKKKLLKFEVKAKMESEAVNALESQVNRKRYEVDNQSALQNRLDALRTEFESKATELELKRQNKMRTWIVEDEEEQVKQKHRLEKARQLSRLEEENKARMEAMSLINRTALEGEAELQQVEFERRKRKVEANEAMLAQEVVQAEQQRETIAMLAMKEAFEAEVEKQNTWLDSQRLQREDEFSKVLDTFHKIMNERRKQLSTIRRARLHKEQQARFLQRFRSLEVQNSTESQAVDSLVKMLLVEQQKDLELSMQLEAEERMLGGRAAFLADVAKTQTVAETEEKKKFVKVRENMVAKASKLEESLRKKHSEIFSKLKFEREKMISELQSEWRQKASEKELHSFEEAARSYKAAQRKLHEVYDKHEKSLQADLEKAREKAVDLNVPDFARREAATQSEGAASASKKQQTMTEKAKADDDSNLEDTDESDMSSSSADDYMPTPESAVPEHELPTSGSESSLGDDFLIRSAKAQKQAEDVIKRHQEA
ncbi:hypothetical protein A3770_11p63340 [Chloropicon primus]|uniref:TBC1 domain family member 31 n=2 Tax=Chloropicon primus TaxID=1764295 RepID=A0A5B8MU21_9CHLO|nr:hypothetical protein A3770_11p63340 [Chloropicon primus]|eukprot:QDZ23816.1 hypothetical protein A3770_11p63340 [Chloropicon primus]